MFTCPNCQASLMRRSGPSGIYWACPHCSGRLVGVAPLRNVMPREEINRVWRAARDGEGWERRPCPACRHRMWEIYPRSPASGPPLDVCETCHMLWFDPDEFSLVTGDAPAVAPTATPSPPPPAPRAPDVPSPAPDWSTVPRRLGPVEKPKPAYTDYIPITTWLAALGIAAGTLAAALAGWTETSSMAFLPSEPLRHGGFTLLTSFFMQPGWLWLAVFGFFLLVFGDQVEDFLKSPPTLLLLGAGHLAGCLLMTAFQDGAAIPVTGAGAGLTALMAFYSLKFPHVQVGRFFVLPGLEKPARWYFAGWVAIQLLPIPTAGPVASVTATGHLGGVLAGILFWGLYRRR